MTANGPEKAPEPEQEPNPPAQPPAAGPPPAQEGAAEEGAAAATTRMESKWGSRWLWAFGCLLLVLSLLISSWLWPFSATIDQQNAAAILALVTAGAVGIERLVEAIWTIVGMSRLGSWWPLRPIGDRLDALVSRLDQPLHTFYEQANDAVQNASTASEAVSQGLASAPRYLDALQEHIDLLKQLEPGDRNARAIAARASRAVVGLKKLYPDLNDVAARANSALAGVDRFVQTFEDNPARRLMSLFAGAILGLIFAGILGLDIVQATLGTKPFADVRFVKDFLPNLGIAATGLVMGLGANPTHELIKFLQESKERRKAQAHQ